MGKIYIGWAEESLVPEKKVSLSGQFYERISDYVESEITVTAMAAEADGEQMILISADVAAINETIVNRARKKFAAMTSEVCPGKLILAATHTHTSHVLSNEDVQKKSSTRATTTAEIIEELSGGRLTYQSLVTADDSVMTPTEATELVTDKIALAAYRAWQARKPASYANEFGRAAVGMCRRAAYADGTAQMWGDTNTADFVSLEGGNDSGIELLYFFDENKKLTGIVANIACPAQILEQRSFISADYWGRAKANIRAKLGKDVYLLGLCGAAGDQCPRDLVRWVEPETPIDDPNVKRPNVIKHKADPSMYDISGCNRVGKRIANEILSVFEEITEIRDEAVFTHKVLKMDLPLRKVTQTEYLSAMRELEYYIGKNLEKQSINFEDVAKMYVYGGAIQRFKEQQFTEIFPIESHIVRFGNVAFCTSPFELFLDYGNRIKARSYAEQTFIVQLCSGSSGYLPTEKAEKAGHYSAYVSSGNVGHEGGDLLVRRTITEINDMWQ